MLFSLDTIKIESEWPSFISNFFLTLSDQELCYERFPYVFLTGTLF